MFDRAAPRTSNRTQRVTRLAVGDESLPYGTRCLYGHSNLEQMADKLVDFRDCDGNIHVPRITRGSFSVLSEVIHQHALAWWVTSRHEKHVAPLQRVSPWRCKTQRDSPAFAVLSLDVRDSEPYVKDATGDVVTMDTDTCTQRVANRERMWSMLDYRGPINDVGGPATIADGVFS